MDDTLSEVWPVLVDVLQEAKGINPVVLNMDGVCSWADCMVIVTASSRAHMHGLCQKVNEYLKDKTGFSSGISGRAKNEDQWLLMDWGAMVIHIMNSEARAYYELEKVWFQAEVLFPFNGMDR